MAIENSSEGKEQGRYMFNLGVTYRRLGKLEASIEKLKRANELQPNKASYSNNLGLSYF